MNLWCYMAIGVAVAFVMKDGVIPQVIACACFLAVFNHLGNRIQSLEERNK